MADLNSSYPASGSGERHETMHQQPLSNQRSEQPQQQPSAANSAAQVGAEETGNQAALDDLRKHGTQMTPKERKQAEEYLRAKYGAGSPHHSADEER
ncbi:hypothetical protein, conserved [Eimeria maxima]|uniref:Uncharacterized protein n=1 Tax=Eimeria maxima TaxID=5804 RepID=U6MBA1_EIMMA|nr:hypothetical protein, conserved [Eimeria maxima]CDJ59749.1 hypothetical protein, conserved [Eimeria maxima]